MYIQKSNVSSEDDARNLSRYIILIKTFLINHLIRLVAQIKAKRCILLFEFMYCVG